MLKIGNRKELLLREPTMSYGCYTDSGNFLLMLSFRDDHRVQTAVYLDGKTGRLIRPVYDVFKEFRYASVFKGEKLRKLSHEEFLRWYEPLGFKDRIFLHYNMFMLKLLYQKDGSFKLAIPSEKFIIGYVPSEETVKHFIILYNRKQKYKRKQIADGTYDADAWKSKGVNKSFGNNRVNDNMGAQKRVFNGSGNNSGFRSFNSVSRDSGVSSVSGGSVDFVSSSSGSVRPKRPRINRSV